MAAVSPAAAADSVRPAEGDQTIIWEVGAYIYKKINPNGTASGGNSGPQTLLEVQPGTSWFVPTVPLPDYVCGPGWAIQEDAVAYPAGAFEWPTHVDLQNGQTVGWPLYDSKHFDLEDLVDVPSCVKDPEIPAFTNETCNAGKVVGGSVTVALDPALVYSLTGPGGLVIDPVLDATTSNLAAGDYTVSVEALAPYELIEPNDFPYSFKIAKATCPQVLPNTGVTTGGTLALAGGLIGLGVIVTLVMVARRPSTRA
jgi:hypothetical protein